MTTPITQRTLFGGDERVADAIALAKSAMNDLPKNLSRAEFTRRAEWLTFMRYPGVLDNLRLIANCIERLPASDADIVMLLDIKADTPKFDTISRAVRSVAPASMEELR